MIFFVTAPLWVIALIWAVQALAGLGARKQIHEQYIRDAYSLRLQHAQQMNAAAGGKTAFHNAATYASRHSRRPAINEPLVKRTVTAPDGFSGTFVVPANEPTEVTIGRLNAMRPREGT